VFRALWKRNCCVGGELVRGKLLSGGKVLSEGGVL